MDTPEIASALEVFIADQTNGPAHVKHLQRMSGGFSYEVFKLYAEWSERGEKKSAWLVLRRAPEGGNLEPYDASVEFRVLQALAGTGVPVPRAYWCESEGKVLGTSFYLMEFIEGDIPLPWSHSIPEDQLPEVQRQFSATLGTLHAVDWEEKELFFLGVPLDRHDPAALALDRCEETLERIQLRPHPVLREVIAHLRANRPYCDRLAIVHNDYRMGNFIWRDGKIRSILDWERVFLGDPMADIAFSRLPLSGWCSISGDMERIYTANSGITVDKARVNYWQLLESLKATIVGLAGMRPFVEGRSSDLRLLQIARAMMAGEVVSQAEAVGLGV